MLTEEFRQKRVDGVRALLDTLEVQQRIGFGDIITGDGSWSYLDVAPNSTWIEAEEAAPLDRGRR
jgi:hypothetical protein